MGTVVLLVAFVIAAFSAATGIVGNVRRQPGLIRSSTLALHAFTMLTVSASCLLIYAFMAHDFTISYVAHNSDSSMSPWYKLTSYWGALEGSLMFWVSLLAIFSSLAVFTSRKRHGDMMGFVNATIMVVQLFFLFILIYSKNPFDTSLTTPPADGDGLNPLLQNYWMVIHPPSLYLGFVSATIPFAFAIGALASGRLDDLWIKSMRSWTLICFFFLSVGLWLGGQWAYEELGWGGIWAWDPVENAGLLPWFTITAFLHSIIVQEARGMLKIWSLTLIILTFFYTILGTFMTRSGVVQSVHAFGEDKELAALFIIFMTTTMLGAFGLLIWRARRLRTTNKFDSFLSREFAFVANNWILLFGSLVVTLLTLLPTIQEHFGAARDSYPPHVFNRIMVPTWLVLIFLMGAAPMLAWTKTSKEKLWKMLMAPTVVGVLSIIAMAVLFPRSRNLFPVVVSSEYTFFQWPTALICAGLIGFTIAALIQEIALGTRARAKTMDLLSAFTGLWIQRKRTYGGHLVHIGVAVMTIGFAGRGFDTSKDFLFTQPCVDIDGQPISPCSRGEIRGYGIEFLGITERRNDLYQEVIGSVRITQNGKEVTKLHPSRRTYFKGDTKTSEVDIDYGLYENVYTVLAGAQRGGDGTAKAVNFVIKVNPLISFVPLGFVLFTIGILIGLFPTSVLNTLTPDGQKGKLGKPGQVAAIVLLIGLPMLGGVSIANAQEGKPPPTRPAEHQAGGVAEQISSGHNTDGAFLHRCQQGSQDAFEVLGAEHANKSIIGKTFKNLICTCGCPRRDTKDCECGFAMQMRCDALKIFKQQFDKGATDDEAMEAVISFFVARDGELARAEPKGSATTAGPLLLAGGGAIVLILAGFFMVQRKKNDEVVTQERPPTEEDLDYLDRVDEELLDA